MFRVFLFIFRYKIKKSKENLGLHCKEFFSLPEKCQNKVLDIYFDKVEENIDIGSYFDNKNARYYVDGHEVSFFNSLYFCQKIIELKLNNIIYIDKFSISSSEKDKLVNLFLNIIKDNNEIVKVDDLLISSGYLPKFLSQNINFMKYLVDIDCYNIKYITYNEKCFVEERNLIRHSLESIKDNEFIMSKFFIENGKLPSILLKNIDFLVYIIKNDINYVKYLSDKILDNLTISDRKRLINTIILGIGSDNSKIEMLFNNFTLSNYLSRDAEFLIYIINLNIDNIKYADFHNIISKDIKKIIDSLSLKLVREKIKLDWQKYPFRNILKQNYMFMIYLINEDRHNIKYLDIPNNEELTRVIDIYLNKYRKCPFDVEDYFDSDGYIKSIFISNSHMLKYLIRHDNKIFKYMDFTRISNASEVVEVIIKEIDKKDFSFDNECFLRNGKYPIIFSNNYRFMRYVIDKNFNNLAYIDSLNVDDKTLKRIINYAFRMVYYIRGNNGNLNFDIDGYFKNSDIINNAYFKECYRSL